MKLIKELLKNRDTEFWTQLYDCLQRSHDPVDLLRFSNYRKKALKLNIPFQYEKKPLRVALIGGVTFHPLVEYLEILAWEQEVQLDVKIGDFDNHFAEVLQEQSFLNDFKPDVVFVYPGPNACKHGLKIDSDEKTVKQSIEQVVGHYVNLSKTLEQRYGVDVFLANFPMSEQAGLGAYRSCNAANDWTYRKQLNNALGLRANAHYQICDLEYISSVLGTPNCVDAKGWYESRQAGSPAFQVEVARELVFMLESLKRSPKKVLVLDLDNTLWGGVIGDDGLDGIELGDSDTRSEAFKSFQKYILTLHERGVLLAVCSKNNMEIAKEPFLAHPEMALRLEHIVSFKANWSAKSDSIIKIAQELNLGLDSFVFVDDNPAEIDIVRQFCPEVSCLLLPDDPSDFIDALDSKRFFEPKNITQEDLGKTQQYQLENKRLTDMGQYLESLNMEAVIEPFKEVNVARIAQLINKSNQFNLTTLRRTEAEVRALTAQDGVIAKTVRLKDRFGDYGLISVLIGTVKDAMLEIDTWLMSCRVLEREVEYELFNELVNTCKAQNIEAIKGVYIPSLKNAMVREHYLKLGFELESQSDIKSVYLFRNLNLSKDHLTHIQRSNHGQG